LTEPRTIGKYEILDLLGVGGMGRVYRARDQVLERIVALKVLRPEDPADPELAESWARFLSEARAVARLNHPTIVAVYQLYDADPQETYFAMEYVDGCTIDKYLCLDENTRVETTLELMCQLLTGLAHAHRQGIVHRDVKPSNLLITREGQLKITDFGIAKTIATKRTQTGMMIGTPSYTAPERFAGEETEPRCDIYSVGVLCFELLAGRRPFVGSMNELIYQICHVPAPLLSELRPDAPKLLDPILARALEKLPGERYQSAQAFHTALMRARQSLGYPVTQLILASPDGNPAVPTAQMRSDPPGWSDEELTDLIGRLSPIMGPMARVLVKRQAALTRDRATLYETLAKGLRSDEERSRFLNAVAGASTQRLADGEASTAEHTIPLPVIEHTTKILTRYLGPIASVLVKKTARAATDEHDFHRQVAERISDPGERAKFVAEMGRP
jgi:serine/threonine protein kinase